MNQQLQVRVMGVGSHDFSALLEPKNRLKGETWEEGLGIFPEEMKAELDPLFFSPLLLY